MASRGGKKAGQGQTRGKSSRRAARAVTAESLAKGQREISIS